MDLDPKMVYRTQYKRFSKLEQVCQFSSKKWNKSVQFVMILDRIKINKKMVRYVLKFRYMRCSGLRWKVCEGFVGFQPYLYQTWRRQKSENAECLICQQEL